MGGRGASKGDTYTKIEKTLTKWIKQNKTLPSSFTLPNMSDRKQHEIAFQTMNTNYRLSNEEKKIYDEIKLITDEDGTKRLYYQGSNRDVTDFNKRAINGMKKWMAFSYINRRR